MSPDTRFPQNRVALEWIDTVSLTAGATGVRATDHSGRDSPANESE